MEIHVNCVGVGVGEVDPEGKTISTLSVSRRNTGVKGETSVGVSEPGGVDSCASSLSDMGTNRMVNVLSPSDSGYTNRGF